MMQMRERTQIFLNNPAVDRVCSLRAQFLEDPKNIPRLANFSSNSAGNHVDVRIRQRGFNRLACQFHQVGTLRHHAFRHAYFLHGLVIL